MYMQTIPVCCAWAPPSCANAASYANMCRYVNSNELPPADSIRVEELINYFHYDYPLPEEGKPFFCSVNSFRVRTPFPSSLMPPAIRYCFRGPEASPGI